MLFQNFRISNIKTLHETMKDGMHWIFPWAYCTMSACYKVQYTSDQFRDCLLHLLSRV